MKKTIVQMRFPNGTRLTKERFSGFTTVWIHSVDSRAMLNQFIYDKGGPFKKGYSTQTASVFDADINLICQFDIDRKQFAREAKRLTKAPIA